jgi:hypothetical protein
MFNLLKGNVFYPLRGKKIVSAFLLRGAVVGTVNDDGILSR